MSLRNRLRAPLIAVVVTTLLGGFVALVPGPAVLGAERATIRTASAQAADKADDRARAERRAKADGLSKSRAVFARSSYLCIGYKACAQAGMSASGYAKVSDKMYWRMYSGHNCTNYAAYRMVRSGLPNERPWSGGGNATYWGTSVPKMTDKVPTVGAVAWWKANAGPAGSAGHVAYVEKVVSADQIIISQDSWGGDFSWAVVTKESGNWPSGFIHFNDQTLVNKAAPVVSGIPKVGEQLTASSGSWNPADAKVSYQWLADGVAIAKATKPTLTLDPSRLGQTLRVRTKATKLGYPTKTSTSAGTAVVLPGSLSNTTAPAISGVAKVERTLSLDPGTWNPAPASTSIQWYADTQPIVGAVGARLKLTPDLAGRAITATVTAERPSYTSIAVSSVPTVPVALGTIKVKRKPTLSGTVKPGRTLTVDPGAYHLGDAVVAIQWLRAGQPIPGATGATYRATRADLGSRLSASVSVSRAGYQSIAPASPVTARVRAAARMKIERTQLKRGVRLKITMLSGWVSPVEGTLLVRVQGGFRQVVTLRRGVGRVVVRGLPRSKRVLQVIYRGSSTVERRAKVGTIRLP